MALPFYLGAWLAVDMGVGAVVMLVWQRVNPADCELLSAAVASGLIAGDGIWTIPSAILASLHHLLSRRWGTGLVAGCDSDVDSDSRRTADTPLVLPCLQAIANVNPPICMGWAKAS